MKQVFNEEVLNQRGEMLTEFCALNELRINNTFYKHKIQNKYTFLDNRGNKSVIDYIITNRTIHPKQILDVRSLNSANIGSDHSLVLSKLRMYPTQGKRKPPIYVEKFNIQSLEDQSTRRLRKSLRTPHSKQPNQGGKY